MRVKEFFHVLRNVFSKKRFLFIGIIAGLAFYTLNVLIVHYATLISNVSSQGFTGSILLFIKILIGFYATVQTHTYISVILIGILFGILTSLISCKISLNLSPEKKSLGIIGTIGVFLAALIPGCAACGVGIASALGLSAFIITFLPFEGIEISLIAGILLLFSIWNITKNMYVCPQARTIFKT